MWLKGKGFEWPKGLHLCDKFYYNYGMRWNGEVQLTDQILVTNPDGSIELNVYGENLKFISKLTFGYLVGERRYGFPMIIARSRPNVLSA